MFSVLLGVMWLVGTGWCWAWRTIVLTLVLHYTPSVLDVLFFRVTNRTV